MDFCSCIYVFRCKLSLVRLCDSDFGITSIDDITIRITLAAFCFHIAHISFASSWYLFCLLVIVLAKLCVFWRAMSLKKVFFVFLFIKVMSGRLKGIVLYAAIPVQLEIFILQYIGWCVLLIWTLSSINLAASASFWWIILVSPSCLFTYSVGASCSHAAVMCWIVSYSFPHHLHSSSVSGCFKIYFL